MLNFEYYAPTKVIFGKATETLVGQEIKKYGGKRVLIHYGGESARRSGLLDRVEESLRQADIAFATLSGVKPNPRLSKVRESNLQSEKTSTFCWLSAAAASLTRQRRSLMPWPILSTISGTSLTAKQRRRPVCLSVLC